jgi:hypothetical protein
VLDGPFRVEKRVLVLEPPIDHGPVHLEQQVGVAVLGAHLLHEEDLAVGPGEEVRHRCPSVGGDGSGGGDREPELAQSTDDLLGGELESGGAEDKSRRRARHPPDQEGAHQIHEEDPTQEGVGQHGQSDHDPAHPLQGPDEERPHRRRRRRGHRHRKGWRGSNRDAAAPTGWRIQPQQRVMVARQLRHHPHQPHGDGDGEHDGHRPAPPAKSQHDGDAHQWKRERDLGDQTGGVGEEVGPRVDEAEEVLLHGGTRRGLVDEDPDEEKRYTERDPDDVARVALGDAEPVPAPIGNGGRR